MREDSFIDDRSAAAVRRLLTLGGRPRTAEQITDFAAFNEQLLQRAVNSSQITPEFAEEVRKVQRTNKPRPATKIEVEFMTFLDGLQSRQGTKIPDFDALYRHRAELDGRPHQD